MRLCYNNKIYLPSIDATSDELFAGIKKAVRGFKRNYAEEIRARNIRDMLSTEVKLVSSDTELIAWTQRPKANKLNTVLFILLQTMTK